VLGHKTYFTGRVIGKTGAPLKNVKVRAIAGPKQADRHFIPHMIYETASDAQGRYRLYVHPDTYCLETRQANGTLVTQTAPIPVSAGQQIARDLHVAREFAFDGPANFPSER
jgi:hypothetical protein